MNLRLIWICANSHISHNYEKLVHMCDVTHLYAWHETCLWRDSFTCVTWLKHTCDMAQSYVWSDSFMCVAWLISMCDVTRPHVRWNVTDLLLVTWLILHVIWHSDSFIYVAWPIHMRTAIWLILLVTWRCDSFIYVAWPIHMWNVTWLILHVM